MNYLQKLFINSVVDIYSDIMSVDLETGECCYICMQNHTLEEVKLEQKWDEVKYMLLQNVVEEDHQHVLELWDSRMVPDAPSEFAFGVNYHVKNEERGGLASYWRMNIAIMENRGKKQAVIFCRDHTIDMKSMFHIVDIHNKDKLTYLYNRFKLEEMIKTEYREMETCGILFFDINDFKKIQDNYGIEEKEHILEVISESIKSLENENVLAYRYDRDSFVVVAKNCSKDSFKDIINLWMHCWEEMADKRTIEYTVALGNAWDCGAIYIEELISKAKTHMYSNKRKLKDGFPMDYYLQEDTSTQFGLYNRHQFLEQMNYKLKYEPGNYCVIAIDIEHFKLYNRWLGRKAGDILLIEISRRLKYYERLNQGIASYIGGDDFALFLPYDERLLFLLEKDLKNISMRKSRNVGFLPAIGVYRVPADAKDAHGMYDMALEASKHVVGNYDSRICYYDESMISVVEKDINILNEAKIALERHQFFLAVQPKCRISSGKIVGAEALVRWSHPEKGMIMPGTFIPVMEKNGVISDLDLYVWEEAARYIRKWMDEGVEPVPISINVSRIDILSMDVVDELNALIRKYNIEKKYLKVEITESAYVENAEKVTETLERLEHEGYTLLMDDFGSGYSSLNMLRKSIVDIIKIDMKFLDMTQEDMQKGLTILKSIIDMSNEMNLPIIVEGVETQEQADILMKMKVRYAQGYLFYRPMAIEDFEKLIQNPENMDYRGIYNKKKDASELQGVMRDVIEKKKKNFSVEAIDLSTTIGGFFTYKNNQEQEIVEVDKIVAGIYGCETVEEFLEFTKGSFKNMVHPDDWEDLQKEISRQIKESVETKTDYVKYRIMKKDGTIGYVNDFAHLKEDKETKEEYFQVFIFDVSKHIK